MCKVEDALKGSYGLASKLSKVIAQLPATVLGSKHKGNVQEVDIVVKEQASLLNHIAINGALQECAQVTLCPCTKVEKQENQKALLVIMVNIGSVF